MDEDKLEGTDVLEKMAEIGKLDAFGEAVDADDFEKARSLMKRAKIDTETIHFILEEMKQKT